MGFLDLSGALGRQFGSIGLALNEIQTRLTLRAAPFLQVGGEDAGRAERYLRDFCRQFAVSEQLALHIDSAVPSHVGLGSGTQMALAVGVAISRFYDLPHTVRDVAALSERGARSGIGIGVFEQGGLVVDGGRGAQTRTPPLLVRLPIPDAWRFILVFDERGQGLHGEFEHSAFRELPPFPRLHAAELCYRLLMQSLPALAEGDLAGFGAVISDLQQTVGAHFAPAQGGVFTSPEVAQIMEWLAAQGLSCIGQTSWGPTGFAATASEQQAQYYCAEIARRFHAPHIRVQIVSACNEAARVQIA
jgi:beta-ribofuranosylaminobenzene 5'-phosphate synthase